MTATEENKPAAIKVSFTAKKTGKTSKYTFTSKVTVVAPKEDEPVVDPSASATKIESVKATSVTTLEVKFDAPVNTNSTGAFKVSRAGTEITVKTEWASDRSSAILTASSAMQTGTYTVEFEGLTGTAQVTGQKATSIQILTTKVGLGNGLGTAKNVYLNVLDQYKNPMEIASNKLEIKATNMSKNLSLTATPSSNTKKPYFTINPTAPSSAIGDKIAIVAYLKSDVSVSVTTTIEIANIYTKEFTFGEVKKASDAHVYVDKADYSYSIDYKAVDSEGTDILLSASAPATLGVGSSTNNITFVSSNPSSIDPEKIKIDAEGKLTFITGSYASKVTLTALNTVTGTTDTIEIEVGDVSKLTTLSMTDVTIPKGTKKAKVEVIGYDQYGEVVKPQNMAKINLTGNFTINGNAADSTTTAWTTIDGKYIELEKLATENMALGASASVMFISKVDPTKMSTVTISIGDPATPTSLEFVSAPATTLFAKEQKEVKVKILDNFNNVIKTGYTITTDVSGAFDANESCAIADGIATIKVTGSAISAGVAETKATLTINLVENTNSTVVATKIVPMTVCNQVSKLLVSTDKDNYTIGDTMKATVLAYNGDVFLSSFNTSIVGKVQVVTGAAATVIKTYEKTLAFKDGVATIDVPASTGIEYVVVTALQTENSTAVANNLDNTNAKSAKLSVNDSGAAVAYDIAQVSEGAIKIVARNAEWAEASWYKGVKTVSVKIVDNNGIDITYDAVDTTNADHSVVNVTFTNGVGEIKLKAGKVNQGSYYTVTVSDGTFKAEAKKQATN